MLAHKNTTLVEEEPSHPAPTRRFKRSASDKSVHNNNNNLTDTPPTANWEATEEETPEVTSQPKAATGLRYISKIASPVTFIVLLGLWQLLTAMAVYPAYIL